MKAIYILAALLMLASCKKDNTTAVPATTQDTIKVQDTVAVVQKPAVSKFERLVLQHQVLTNDAVSGLHKATALQANSIYETYLQQSGKIIGELNNHDGRLLEEYYRYFLDEKNPPEKNDTLQQKIKLLKGAGLEYRSIGEGMGEITNVPDHYYKIFKNKVTPDYTQYLMLTAEDDKVGYAYDAGLAVPFEEVGRRARRWETFVKKYPESKLKARAKEIYAGYQLDFLFGLDNTPTMEFSTGELYPENREVFNKYIAAYPESYTSELAKLLLETKETREDVLLSQITKLQKKHLDRL